MIGHTVIATPPTSHLNFTPPPSPNDNYNERKQIVLIVRPHAIPPPNPTSTIHKKKQTNIPTYIFACYKNLYTSTHLGYLKKQNRTEQKGKGIFHTRRDTDTVNVLYAYNNINIIFNFIKSFFSSFSF